MLIQDAVGKSLGDNIDCGQAFYHALAAAAFNDLEFPNIFVTELHAPIARPRTENEMFRLLAVIGFGAVVRYAKEHKLDADFFDVK